MLRLLYIAEILNVENACKLLQAFLFPQMPFLGDSKGNDKTQHSPVRGLGVFWDVMHYLSREVACAINGEPPQLSTLFDIELQSES